MTPKDRNLIKGALRRAFSRSELHRRASERFRVEHFDPKRPRVKKWCWCALCGEVTPEWTMSLDHISPVIPVNTSFESMSLDDTVDRLWCEEIQLQMLCDPCHSSKTKAEKQQRKALKNER